MKCVLVSFVLLGTLVGQIQLSVAWNSNTHNTNKNHHVVVGHHPFHWRKTLTTTAATTATATATTTATTTTTTTTKSTTGMNALSLSAKSSNEHNEEDSLSSSMSTSCCHRRRQLGINFFATSMAMTLGVFATTPVEAAHASYIDPITSPPTITSKVYLDVEYTPVPKGIIGGTSTSKKTGRLVIGVYGEAMPKVSDNFVTLARNNAYAGSSFYRIISGYSIQGGDIVKSTSSSSSSPLPLFDPDNFNVKHTQKGLLSMVRADREGRVDSRFFIQLVDDGGWADDRYAAFATVLEGMDVVEEIEQLPVQPPKNNPKQPVTIVASGIL